MSFTDVSWQAVTIGTISAFLLGMIWFSPLMFIKAWSAGSHDLQPPDKPPIMAMLVQFCGTFVLALIIGIAMAMQVFEMAILAILAPALLVAGMDLFSQKTPAAVLIDASYILCGGGLMLLAQALF